MSKEQIPLILDGMKEGNSLRMCCEAAGVSRSTFLSWVDADEALADLYAHARTHMLDAQAEALEDIGTQASLAEGAVEVAGLRLKSDNRKWLLARLAPRKYGDKLELAGGLTVKTVTDMTDGDLAAIAAGSSR